MNLDELKETWRAEMATMDMSSELQTGRIQEDVTKFHRGMGFGTYMTIFANLCGCALAVAFGWLSPDRISTEQKLAIFFYVLATISITYFMLRARLVRAPDDWTLRARLEVEIERLERQRNLWKNGALWFVVPLAIYCALALPVRLYPLPILVYSLVYWLVRWTTRRQIDPLLSRLRGLYQELVAGEAGECRVPP